MNKTVLLSFLLLACSGESEPPDPGVAPDVSAPPKVADLVLRLPSSEAFTPVPTPSSPDLDRTVLELSAVVDRHAGDPANPWAIAHGMLARGPGFVLTNGEPALTWLYANYAQVSTIEGEECTVASVYIGLDHTWFAATGRPPDNSIVTFMFSPEDFWASVT